MKGDFRPEISHPSSPVPEDIKSSKDWPEKVRPKKSLSSLTPPPGSNSTQLKEASSTCVVTRTPRFGVDSFFFFLVKIKFSNDLWQMSYGIRHLKLL